MALNSAINAGGGTTTTVLHGNATGSPTYGQIVNADITNGTIDLTTKVTGILPIANGGTNNATFSNTGIVFYDSASGGSLKNFSNLRVAASTQINMDNANGNAASLVFILDNMDTTSTSSSLIRARTNAAGGDPFLRLSITGGTDWYVGIDNSNSDVFEIGNSVSGPGNTPRLRIDSSGTVSVIAGNLVVSDATKRLQAANLSASSPVFTDASSNLISTGTVPVGSGGTGIGSGTSGGIPYFSSTSTIASSGALTANALVLGGGPGATPTSLAVGTTNTVLHGNTGSAPSYSQIVNADITNATIDLTTKVTGILPAANGGVSNGFTAFTGPTTSTKTFTLPNASATILTTNAVVTVAQGGTGTGTAFTQGSVVFAGASGVYSQNNSAFFWNNTGGPTGAGSLGIGTTASAYTMTVVNTNPDVLGNVALMLLQTSNVSPRNMLDIFAPSLVNNTVNTFIRFGANSTSPNFAAIQLNYQTGGSGSFIQFSVGNTSVFAVGTTSAGITGALNVGGDLSQITLGSTLTILGAGLVTPLTNNAVSNARTGRITLTGVTNVLINNTTITTNSLIFISRVTAVGTIGTITYTITPGASFSVKSSTGETSVVNFLIIEGA